MVVIPLGDPGVGAALGATAPGSVTEVAGWSADLVHLVGEPERLRVKVTLLNRLD
jgi:hypothetical protein